MKFIQKIILAVTVIVAAGGLSCKKSKTAGPVTDPPGAPPKTWQEHWFQHDLLVNRVYFDQNVAFYEDDDVTKSVTWPFETMSKVWSYVKKTYGAFGDSTRLYVIFHQGKLGGGHPASYFDESHDYRNTIDCGLDSWNLPTGEKIGVPIHETGHIVCGASHGVQGSPSDVLWGDSKFMEIYNYDVMMNIGREDEAARVYDEMQTQTDTFPVAGSQWFKNWFYPIYSKYGHAAVLNKYFQLLADNFPKVKNAHGYQYTRNLNYGEFIHFWSGAAGVNLKAQATIAFGWPDEWEQEFNQAKIDFPNVKYTN
ncbi:hypothetical protein SAMN05216464_102312 [Mucilaginibacter pineti]|uniref:Uncharacterized protein n=1 Tax=Mucilaginibacter pineti TaxID=1391627 RepID=A0A1G6WXY1_9SPHI|nr:hypothetical protein [Mucilaginibacter pineti]SDD69916.1 hypothetical protein SAMN05216464_102312 [Mucilaginibacter pineti]